MHTKAKPHVNRNFPRQSSLPEREAGPIGHLAKRPLTEGRRHSGAHRCVALSQQSYVTRRARTISDV